MLHQELKVKKLNNFSNLKSVVCELCIVSLWGLNVINMLQDWEFSIEKGVNGKICFCDVTRYLIVLDSYNILILDLCVCWWTVGGNNNLYSLQFYRNG